MKNNPSKQAQLDFTSQSTNNYDEIPSDLKRDIAFNAVTIIRETISIAQKRTIKPTYEQALKIIFDIDENFYNFCSAQLTKKNENDLVKFYKELASVESITQGKEVTAKELLNKEAGKYRTLLNTPDIEKERTKFLFNHLASLEAAIENLKERRLSEHRILQADFCKVDRSFLGAEFMFENHNYIDYKIPDNRYLRLRLLHPDKPEHILGADLIYEQLNVETEMVRVTVLQYKTWEKGILYFSTGNIQQVLKGRLIIDFLIARHF
jgi:hypothetical protein